METELLGHLTVCATAYCDATGHSASTVAQRALGDWRFFDRAREGGSFTARKYDAAMAWFSANWPPELAWPQDVPRPAVDVACERRPVLQRAGGAR